MGATLAIVTATYQPFMLTNSFLLSNPRESKFVGCEWQGKLRIKLRTKIYKPGNVANLFLISSISFKAVIILNTNFRAGTGIKTSTSIRETNGAILEKMKNLLRFYKCTG